MPISGYQNQDFRTIPGLWPCLEGVAALDLGCGIGLYSDALARRGARVVGVDFGLENLRLARENDTTGSGRWICADARHLPFRAEAFGVVVSVEVLTHLSPADRQQALAETGRVATEGAAVYLTLHNKTRLDWRSWLALRPAQSVYQTSNLRVWPTYTGEAVAMAQSCGMQPVAKPSYLNFYSRFSVDFVRRHPFAARSLSAVEELCRHLPIARRAAITFMLWLRREDR